MSCVQLIGGPIAFLLFSTIACAQSIPVILEKSDGSVPDRTHELFWSAEPGVRYQVESATDLNAVDGWSPLIGPVTAAGLVEEAGLNAGDDDVPFYRVAQLDDQPPAIVERFPDDGDFAIGRFDDVVVELGDMTGVDTGSSGP